MTWKHDTWWFAVSFAFVCGISFGGYLCSLWYEEEEFIYPPPVAIAEQEVVEQAIFPVEQGKRSEPGRLSPEMQHRVDMAEFYRGERSQAWADGPPGKNAPWRRKK